MPLESQQNQNDDPADVLADVSLVSFQAQPAAIGPFGASDLSWEVSGPSGFHVVLNSANVTKKGEQIVQPASSTIYRLSAQAGQASKFLGSVQVAVDRSSCESFDILNPQPVLEGPIRNSIENSDDLYFRTDFFPPNPTFPQTSQPIPPLAVSFSPGRIRLQLRLKKRSGHWYFPDPKVDIDASFGLVVRDGVLEATAEQISVDVSVPFWAWAYPGAIPGLAIAIDMGREDAIKRMHNSIQGLAELLNALAIPSKGKRLSSVHIDEGLNGAGHIELTACSADLLLRFAQLSGGVIIG